MIEEFVQGEAVIFLESYDLFDKDMEGKEAMFYKHTFDGKCLVLDVDSGEWAEPLFSTLKRKKPGQVPRKYANICKTIKEMVITY